MKLKVVRDMKEVGYTAGQLFIDDVFFCFTLEDELRVLGENCEGKVKAKTAIPAGEYTVILSFSNRFKKYLPQILNVRCFVGIRIHGGNDANDTEGCILLGYERSSSAGMLAYGTSRPAVTELIKRMGEIEKTEKIVIEIV